MKTVSELGKLTGMGTRPTPARFLAALARVGVTSYGGPAIVAQLREELVVRRRWCSEEEFAESLAFAQLVPGPVVPATAAHAAQRLFGPGMVFPAVLAYAAPAFFLMLGLSVAYFRWGSLPAVHSAFRALGPVIVAIIASSLLSLAQPALRDTRGVALAAVLAPFFFLPINPVLVVLAGAALGILVMPHQDHHPDAIPTPQQRRREGLFWGFAVGCALVSGLALASWYHPALARLGVEVAQVALLAFGGGYTAVALMFHAFVVSQPPILSPKEFVDGLALGQLTPGPVVITSTFVGYKVAGLAGAMLATLYTFFPPACLVATLAPHFARLRQAQVFRKAVRGVLAAFVALLVRVLAQMAQAALVPIWAAPLAVGALVLLRLKVPVLALVAATVVLSLALMP
ncbi:MAG: chromate efflux transporter [Thermoanaerobaculum sp.]|nr:chromate efflux transporter [Thermoanaerobaculum sp.]MDW7968301.1 chromate efflux transporter [Thermoanaerobaculum sp.]